MKTGSLDLNLLSNISTNKCDKVLTISRKQIKESLHFFLNAQIKMQNYNRLKA